MGSLSRGGPLFIGLAAVAATLAIGGVAAATIPSSSGTFTACVAKARGTIRLIDPTLGAKSRRGRCVKGEQKIAWNRRAPAGSAGVTGPQGTPGAAGASGVVGAAGSAAVSGFSGHVMAVPSTPAGLVRLVFGSPLGTGTENGSESSVETLTPNVPITIGNLTALETAAPLPASDQISVHVNVNGAAVLGCVIVHGDTTCNSGSKSAIVPAGSLVSIRIEPDASFGVTIPGFDLLFGFEATSS